MQSQPDGPSEELVAQIARRWRLDASLLSRAFDLVAAIRCGADDPWGSPPVFRQANKDREHGAFTAASSEQVPRHDRMMELADQMESLAICLEIPSIRIPLLRAHHQEILRSRVDIDYDQADSNDNGGFNGIESMAIPDDPDDQITVVAELLRAMARRSRISVSDDSRPKPTANLSWQADVIRLGWFIWSEIAGRDMHWKRRPGVSEATWPLFISDILVALGADDEAWGLSSIIDNPTQDADSLMELRLDVVGFSRSQNSLREFLLSSRDGTLG